MESSASILERVRLLHEAGEQNHRDCLLEIGRLLHEFILAYLREGDELPKHARVKVGITRHRAFLLAAEKMETTPKRISRLLGVAMTDNLLGKGAVVRPKWTVIREFQVFIHRKLACGLKFYSNCPSSQDISASEDWFLKEEYKQTATELWYRAINENWSVETAVKSIQAVFSETGKSRRKKGPRIPKQARSPLQSLARAASLASPGDIAEMCMELILKAENPQAVAAVLEGRLKTLPKRKSVVA